MSNFFVLLMTSVIEFMVFYWFFNAFQQPRTHNKLQHGLFVLLCAFSLTVVNMLNNSIANMVFVVVLSVVLSRSLFIGNVRTVLALCITVNACLIISEVLSAMIVFLGTGIVFSDLQEGSFIYIAALLMSKAVLVIVVNIAVALNSIIKQKNGVQSAMAAVFPLVSTLSIVSIYYLSSRETDGQNTAIFIFIVCIAMLAACLIVVYIFDKSIQSQALKVKLQMAEQMLQAGVMYDKEKERTIHDLQMLTHDFRKQPNMIKYMYGHEQSKEAESLCTELLNETKVEIFSDMLSLNNSVASAILHRAKMICSNNNIAFDLRIECNDLSFLRMLDTGAILDNAMDNAVEACMKVEDGKRFIKFSLVEQGDMVVIRVENSFAQPLKEHAGKLLTTKEGTAVHGFGLTKIEETVRQYGGDVSYQCPREGVFSLIVRLVRSVELQNA